MCVGVKPCDWLDCTLPLSVLGRFPVADWPGSPFFSNVADVVAPSGAKCALMMNDSFDPAMYKGIPAQVCVSEVHAVHSHQLLQRVDGSTAYGTTVLFYEPLADWVCARLWKWVVKYVMEDLDEKGRHADHVRMSCGGPEKHGDIECDVCSWTVDPMRALMVLYDGLVSCLAVPRCIMLVSAHAYLMPDAVTLLLKLLTAVRTLPVSSVSVEGMISSLIFEVPAPLPGTGSVAVLLMRESDLVKSFLMSYVVKYYRRWHIGVKYVPGAASAIPENMLTSFRALRRVLGVPVELCAPAANAMPSVGFSLDSVLLSGISAIQLVDLVNCMCVEAKVVFVSKDETVLTSFAIGMVSLLYPLRWHMTYVPVCPEVMLDVVHAPFAFLLGLTVDQYEVRGPSFIRETQREQDMCVVYDIDDCTLLKVGNIPSLPGKVLGKVVKAVDDALSDWDRPTHVRGAWDRSTTIGDVLRGIDNKRAVDVVSKWANGEQREQNGEAPVDDTPGRKMKKRVGKAVRSAREAGRKRKALSRTVSDSSDVVLPPADSAADTHATGDASPTSHDIDVLSRAVYASSREMVEVPKVMHGVLHDEFHGLAAGPVSVSTMDAVAEKRFDRQSFTPPTVPVTLFGRSKAPDCDAFSLRLHDMRKPGGKHRRKATDQHHAGEATDPANETSEGDGPVEQGKEPPEKIKGSNSKKHKFRDLLRLRGKKKGSGAHEDDGVDDAPGAEGDTESHDRPDMVRKGSKGDLAALTMVNVPPSPQASQRQFFGMMGDAGIPPTGTQDGGRQQWDAARATLVPVSSDTDEMGTVPHSVVNGVRKAFLRCFVKILMNYKDFMVDDIASLPAQPSVQDMFDMEGFIRQWRKKSDQEFVRFLAKTQMFSVFVDERCNDIVAQVDERERLARSTGGVGAATQESASRVARGQLSRWDITYFDEAIRAKKNRSIFASTKETPFLDFSKWCSVVEPVLSGFNGDGSHTHLEQSSSQYSPYARHHTSGPVNVIHVSGSVPFRERLCGRLVRQMCRHVMRSRIDDRVATIRGRPAHDAAVIDPLRRGFPLLSHGLSSLVAFTLPWPYFYGVQSSLTLDVMLPPAKAGEPPRDLSQRVSSLSKREVAKLYGHESYRAPSSILESFIYPPCYELIARSCGELLTLSHGLLPVRAPVVIEAVSLCGIVINRLCSLSSVGEDDANGTVTSGAGSSGVGGATTVTTGAGSARNDEAVDHSEAVALLEVDSSVVAQVAVGLVTGLVRRQVVAKGLPELLDDTSVEGDLPALPGPGATDDRWEVATATPCLGCGCGLNSAIIVDPLPLALPIRTYPPASGGCHRLPKMTCVAAGGYDNEEEDDVESRMARYALLPVAALVIQARVRGWLARLCVKRRLKAIVFLQAQTRMVLTRRLFVRRRCAIAYITRWWHMVVARRQFMRQRNAANAIRALWKRTILSRKLARVSSLLTVWSRDGVLFRSQREAVVRIQKWWRGHLARRAALVLTIESAGKLLRDALAGPLGIVTLNRARANSIAKGAGAGGQDAASEGQKALGNAAKKLAKSAALQSRGLDDAAALLRPPPFSILWAGLVARGVIPLLELMAAFGGELCESSLLFDKANQVADFVRAAFGVMTVPPPTVLPHGAVSDARKPGVGSPSDVEQDDHVKQRNARKNAPEMEVGGGNNEGKKEAKDAKKKKKAEDKEEKKKKKEKDMADKKVKKVKKDKKDKKDKKKKKKKEEDDSKAQDKAKEDGKASNGQTELAVAATGGMGHYGNVPPRVAFDISDRQKKAVTSSLKKVMKAIGQCVKAVQRQVKREEREAKGDVAGEVQRSWSARGTFAVGSAAIAHVLGRFGDSTWSEECLLPTDLHVESLVGSTMPRHAARGGQVSRMGLVTLRTGVVDGTTPIVDREVVPSATGELTVMGRVPDGVNVCNWYGRDLCALRRGVLDTARCCVTWIRFLAPVAPVYADGKVVPTTPSEPVVPNAVRKAWAPIFFAYVLPFLVLYRVCMCVCVFICVAYM